MMRAVIFQGPNVRDIVTDATVVHPEFTVENIETQINNNNIHQNGLVIINTHGRIDEELPHRVQLRNQNNSWIETRVVFTALTRSPHALTVQLYACFASAACTNDLVSRLPRGSLVGFYAPRNAVSRMEVSEKLIDKSLALKTQGLSMQEILWLTTPLFQTFIAYHHPQRGVQSIELPLDYRSIKNQGDLLVAKFASLRSYNIFLQNNELNPLSERIFHHLNWLKDMWFMQIVVELTTSPVRRYAAVAYLRDVADVTLKSHTMALASMPAKNLIDYFRAWRDENIRRGGSGENDQIIVQALEPLYIIPEPVAVDHPQFNL